MDSYTVQLIGMGNQPITGHGRLPLLSRATSLDSVFTKTTAICETMGVIR